MKFLLIGTLLAAFVGLLCFSAIKCLRSQNSFESIEQPVTNVAALIKLFPKTAAQVKELSEWGQAEIKKAIQEVLDVPTDSLNFDNSFEVLDRAERRFSAVSGIIGGLKNVCPDRELRETCQVQEVVLSKFWLDAVFSKPLFNALNTVWKKIESGKHSSKLTDTQIYFAELSITKFKIQGLELKDSKFQEFKALAKTAIELESKFQENNIKVNTKLDFTEAELDGVTDKFLESLPRAENGKCLVDLSYPSIAEVMANCKVRETRKRLHIAFTNRAWPENDKVLSELLAVRAKMASVLGFENYAAYDTKLMMAKNPERVRGFLDNVLDSARAKVEREFEILKDNLPEGLELDKDGKFKFYDLAFIKENYKKDVFGLDQNKIKEYFPLDSTISGLLGIYQKLFSLKFTVHDGSALWHKDVKIIEVFDNKENRHKGFVILDLHPRSNKYSHACEIGILKSVESDGTLFPGACIVVANFPKENPNLPALLRFDDAKTFFHEFGHAMHEILGTQELCGFSGTGVLWDFVETPSMMFEEWMLEADVLKGITRHYKTGQPMPDELISKIINNHSFDRGYFAARHVAFAKFSLLIHSGEGEAKDFEEVWKESFGDALPQVDSSTALHAHANFGHLVGYASKYYTYLWSLVLASALFENILFDGLESPEAGRKVRALLSAGGSKHPEKLVEEFLGGEPTFEAFNKRMGFKISTDS